MPVLNIANRLVGDGQPVFIIAEIGQNHQGDVATAERLIEEAAKAGVDCVKFQKSSLQHKYTTSVLHRRYDSPAAFGVTYGDHKAFLEFSEDDFFRLQTKAAQCNVLMTASAMDEISLEFLLRLKVPFIKIGSGDSNNLRLIRKAAEASVPLVVSTGMSELSAVQRIYESIGRPFGLLQCTSSYPTLPEDVNLEVLKTYQSKFPNAIIGYSGHEEGFIPTLGAVAKGAKIIERHFTLDKGQKGSDHMCSLDPIDMQTMVKQIRLMERALGSAEKNFLLCERPCFDKLGKTIVAGRKLTKGEIITDDRICIKVADPQGWDPLNINELYGKTVTKDIDEDDPITSECFA